MYDLRKTVNLLCLIADFQAHIGVKKFNYVKRFYKIKFIVAQKYWIALTVPPPSLLEKEAAIRFLRDAFRPLDRSCLISNQVFQ